MDIGQLGAQDDIGQQRAGARGRSLRHASSSSPTACSRSTCSPATSIKVGQLGPGEVIGEISWLDRKPVSASVRAVETSAVMALSTAMLERKLAEDPVFAARLFRAHGHADGRAPAPDDLQGAPLGMGGRDRGPAGSGAGGRRNAQEDQQTSRRSLRRRTSRRSRATARSRTSTPCRSARRSTCLERDIGPQGGETMTGLADAPAGGAAAVRPAHRDRKALLHQAARLCRRLPDHRDDLQEHAGRRRPHRPVCSTAAC